MTGSFIFLQLFFLSRPMLVKIMNIIVNDSLQNSKTSDAWWTHFYPGCTCVEVEGWSARVMEKLGGGQAKEGRGVTCRRCLCCWKTSVWSALLPTSLHPHLHPLNHTVLPGFISDLQLKWRTPCLDVNRFDEWGCTCPVSKGLCHCSFRRQTSKSLCTSSRSSYESACWLSASISLSFMTKVFTANQCNGLD